MLLHLISWTGRDRREQAKLPLCFLLILPLEKLMVQVVGPQQTNDLHRLDRDKGKTLTQEECSYILLPQSRPGGRGMEYKKNKSADIGRLCCFEAEDKFLRDSLPHYCFTACFPDRRPSVHQRPIGSLWDSG